MQSRYSMLLIVPITGPFGGVVRPSAWDRSIGGRGDRIGAPLRKRAP